MKHVVIALGFLAAVVLAVVIGKSGADHALAMCAGGDLSHCRSDGEPPR